MCIVEKLVSPLCFKEWTICNLLEKKPSKCNLVKDKYPAFPAKIHKAAVVSQTANINVAANCPPLINYINLDIEFSDLTENVNDVFNFSAIANENDKFKLVQNKLKNMPDDVKNALDGNKTGFKIAKHAVCSRSFQIHTHNRVNKLHRKLVD